MRRMPDLTTRLFSKFVRHGGMNNLTKILGIVFAPILMRNTLKSNRDYPFRAATIQWRAEDNGRPGHFARLDQNTEITGVG